MARKNRKATMNFIWGRNGTGKSTFVRTLLDDIFKERAIIVTYKGAPEIWRDLEWIDPANSKEMKSFKGYRQVYFSQHENETFTLLNENFRRGVLVFDDCGFYFPTNLKTGPGRKLKMIATDFRHNMIDVIVIVHAGRDIPRGLWPHYDNAFVGATDMKLESNLPLINRKKLDDTQKKVNEDFNRLYKPKGEDHYGLFYRVKA